MNGCEESLARHLEDVLARGDLPDLEVARAAVAPVPSALPSIRIPAPDPAAYDGLLADPVI
jgi:hypothetical protein